jgi:methionyl-tRNA formyltransferase
MSKTRILFMGTPDFAVASLNALVEAGFEIVAVVTAPDRPAGRGRQLRMSAVKERALELGLAILQPERLRDPSFQSELDRLKADLYVVVAFRMLPETIWSKPKLGTINLHASLLPQYRGAAPINWAIIRGERRTGVTTFFIQHEIDSGDMIESAELEIGPEENAGTLHDRLKGLGASLLANTVRSIIDGTARAIPQPKVSGDLQHAPKLSNENCRIDWGNSTQRVHDLIRGLSPYPGAATTLQSSARGRIAFKVLASRMAGGTTATSGSISIRNDRLFVSCGDGSLELLEVQPEGRKRMTAAEFVHGAAGLGDSHFS